LWVSSTSDRLRSWACIPYGPSSLSRTIEQRRRSVPWLIQLARCATPLKNKTSRSASPSSSIQHFQLELQSDMWPGSGSRDDRTCTAISLRGRPRGATRRPHSGPLRPAFLSGVPATGKPDLEPCSLPMLSRHRKIVRADTTSLSEQSFSCEFVTRHRRPEAGKKHLPT
jgi:hypothetical protein